MNDMVLFTERNSSKQRFSGSLATLDFNSTASSIILMMLVQLHFKAFLVKLRKARVQYLRSVPDDLFRFAVGASVHIVGQPCLDDVAFLTVDGFCAESGNLDVGVSDAKEFKSVVHEHFKAFFRK